MPLKAAPYPMRKPMRLSWNDNDFKVRATARELYEAINLKYAMSYIIDNAGNFLTEKMIIHIGVLINKNIDEIDGYRTVPVQIRGADIFASPRVGQKCNDVLRL